MKITFDLILFIHHLILFILILIQILFILYLIPLILIQITILFILFKNSIHSDLTMENLENVKKSTVYDPITYKIIGCAMEVHNNLGIGFPEVIYQRCLAIEFEKVGLNFEREANLPLFYKELKVGSRQADFLVESDIIVELKATSALIPDNYAQGLNYLTAYKKDKGLLINFGSQKLEYKLLFRRR
jgi:GxxExxY protein